MSRPTDPHDEPTPPSMGTRTDDDLVSAVLDGEATAEEIDRVHRDPALTARLAEFSSIRAALADDHDASTLDHSTRNRLIAGAIAGAAVSDVATEADTDPAGDGTIRPSSEPVTVPASVPAAVPFGQRSRIRPLWLAGAAAALIVVIVGVSQIRTANDASDGGGSDSAASSGATADSGRSAESSAEAGSAGGSDLNAESAPSSDEAQQPTTTVTTPAVRSDAGAAATGGMTFLGSYADPAALTADLPRLMTGTRSDVMAGVPCLEADGSTTVVGSALVGSNMVIVADVEGRPLVLVIDTCAPL